jgi:ABC-type lipoprotein release transport system permease subunit
VKSGRLVLRSLRHHARAHLGAFLTAALVAAVITAALGVGDSVRIGMDRVAAARIGDVRYAAHAPGRLWRAKLADALRRDLDTTVSASLQLNASLGRPDGSAGIRGARVLGVDDAFWSLSPAGRAPLSPWPRDGVAVSESVAARLGLAVGDSLVVRIESPAPIPRDASLSTDADATDRMMVTVAAVLDTRDFAAFSLRIGPVAPANVFLPLENLQRAVDEEGLVNTLLVADAPGGTDRIREAVATNLRFADAGLKLTPLDGQRGWEIRSRRVFIESSVTDVALDIGGTTGVLTWFVNDLRVGDRRTPYSMVAALPPDGGLIPKDLGDDEIVVNEWLAEDFGARPGDRVTLTYLVLAERSGLTERTTEFLVREVVPITGLAGDRGLMPEFPGISESDDCRDWDPGFHIDLDRVRDKDETYWDEYRGTPKAFVTLATGRRLWGNRFGDLTAIRIPREPDPIVYEAKLLSRLDPVMFGLSFTDLRAAEVSARSEGMDFGSLFLGFSAFLILAALLLMGLVVALSVGKRQGEIATLAALGFTRGRVFRLLAVEHALIALGGGVVGVVGGVALTAGALAALRSVWSDVSGSLPMEVVVRAATLTFGMMGGTVVSLLAAAFVLWRSIGRSMRQAFAREEELAARIERSRSGRRFSGWIGIGLAAIAVTIALLAGTGRDPATAGAFFGSGILLLAATLAFSWFALGGVRGRRMTTRALAWRNLGRRRGRSVTTIGVLAFGVFMFLGVTVFRRDPLETAHDPASGTGGFALVGDSSVAVVADLNRPEGRRAHALPDAGLKDVRVVGLRVRAGDDASCRNLTRAQEPEVVGVDPAALSGRFTFVAAEGDPDDPWTLLDTASPAGTVPAVIDQATFWTLGKGLGAELELVDESGRPFVARIAGVIDNAVLHGHLIVSESRFVERYPSESGHRRFLIDVPAARTDEVAALLSRQLEDFGLELERSERRLNTLNAVENTYLGIFQALGGIGLLLGSIGLALVVGRNTLERRSELALLGAVGFPPARISRLVMREHAVLLMLGLLAGIVASALALLPALETPGARVATPGMAAVLVGLALGGLVWTRLAVRAALRGRLIGNLREE